jgi:hypothetical protein
MVRRVGFGNKDNEESGLTTAELIKSRLDSAAEPQDTKPMSGPVRVFTIIFLGVWLLGWSGGIIFAVIALFTGNDFSKFFLIFWIVLASAGWLFAVKALRALLRGESISGAPVKERKAHVSDTRNTPTTLPDSVPNKPDSVQDRDTSIRATQLSRNELLFKVAKIVAAVLIAIRIESNIMFLILFLWAGKEIWSLLRKTPTAPDAEQ